VGKVLQIFSDSSLVGLILNFRGLTEIFSL